MTLAARLRPRRQSAIGIRHSAMRLHWPRVYLYCGLLGFALGLLILGPLCFGPPKLPVPVEMRFSLHVGK